MRPSPTNGQAKMLALGTAQFGIPYGIANRRGRIGRDEAAAILRKARAAGMDTLDTAIAYGESERVLGEIGVQGWRVVTKLKPVPEGIPDTAGWVESEVSASLERLQTSRLYAILLHRPEQLLQPCGKAVYTALQGLKRSGVTGKIGVSVYGPSELGPLFSRYSFDLVQAPFNVFDRRLTESGWMSRLSASGVEIHVRSVFLQGLLLLAPQRRLAKFGRWQPLWDRWQRWLYEKRLTPLQACLGFVASHPIIGRVVVGVDTESQLEEIVSAHDGTVPYPPPDLASEDEDLVNPSRWNYL